MAKQPAPEQHIIGTFTSEQWPGTAGQNVGSVFVGMGIIGFVLCLVLMIVIPGLRSFGAVTWFTAIFAVTFTVLGIAAQISAAHGFLRNLNAKVNDTILALTGDPNAQLSVPELRALIDNGKHHPLPVNGIPGIDLAVVRTPGAKPGQNTVSTVRVIVTVTPPDYGIASFDRLLDAAGGTGSGPTATY